MGAGSHISWQLNGRAACYCPRQPGAHWHGEQGARSAADIGRGQLAGSPMNGYNAMTPADPTSGEIREVIAHLRTLADTFPGLIHAANGPGLSGSPMNTMGALDRACEMLRRHSIDVEAREQSKRIDAERELIRTIFDNGVKTGIEQEKDRAAEEWISKQLARNDRAKEARKGRKRAKKS